METIIALPATTRNRLRAKAAVVRHEVDIGDPEEPHWLALSLTNDILRGVT